MTDSTDFAALLKGLEGALRRRVPWPRIIDALERLESAGPADPAGRPWARILADRTGYSVNQIRRSQRTWATVIELAAKDPEARARLESHAFAHLEVIARIASLSPEYALQCLKGVGLTHASLLAEYKSLKDARADRLSPQKMGHRNAQKLGDAALAAISTQRKVFDLDPATTVVRWPEMFAYARPLCVAITPSPWDLEAFLATPSREDPTRRTSDVIKLAMTASYFSRVHLIVQNDAAFYRSECHMLGLTNVQVYAMSADGDDVRMIMPATGAPIPDRRHLLLKDHYRERLAGLLR